MTETKKIFANEGDVLFVTTPRMNVQVIPFNNLEIGGFSYSRKLLAGDDPDAELARIYGWLNARSAAYGRHKLEQFVEELRAAGKIPPKKA